MANRNVLTAKVIPLSQARKPVEKPRKSGMNRNKDGSVRNINGKIYVDFMYLGERVREPSGLIHNAQNVRTVRGQLDRISVAVKSGTFRFAEVFPASKKAGHFSEKERDVYGLNKSPGQLACKDYFSIWYDLVRRSERVTERTLFGYKGIMNLYLRPFFGELAFADLNPALFDRFIAWARQQCYLGKPIANKTINKSFTVLKMICKSAAIEYGWGSNFDPFYGWKKLPEGDYYENISPFPIGEQRVLLDHLPAHWEPYFRFAFCMGLRSGEQIGLKPDDIDWKKETLHVRRAMTVDENGKSIEGRTKNRYSRRSIKLIPMMLEALQAQKEIYDGCGGEYFFCTTSGAQVHLSNLRRRVWIPALKEAGLRYREMKQTRHTFATLALSCGENPLWIAQVMGHRNTEMIIKVYGKYVEDADGSKDGGLMNGILKGIKGSHE